MQPHANRQSKKKRLLAVLLIFGLPVLLVLSVLLSLYHPPSTAAASTAKADGFNRSMPSPNLKEREKNKLEVYLDAEKDSIRRQQLLHNDPYAKTVTAPRLPTDSLATTGRIPEHPAWQVGPPPVDSNERKVNEHLARLYNVLHNSPTALSGKGGYSASVPSDPTIDRLQELQIRLHQQDTTASPQLQQINALLDKVLAIQHPDHVKPADAIRSTIIPGAYSVSARDPDSAAQDNGFTTAGEIPIYGALANAFYGLSDDSDSPAAASQVIRAVVHADQTIQTGSVVKLRLLQDIFIKGIRIPANSFIFGPCTISNERVAIHLSQVQCQGQVYPIDMRVLDGVDALEGLYVPGAISRDVLKEGAGQSVSSLGLTSMDPSLGAQAAAAGIETARNLIGRKIRLITATLKAGTLVILLPAQSHP